MFIGDPSKGIPARMSQQEIQGCLYDINEIAECRRLLKSTDDIYYQHRIWILKDSLRQRIRRAFENNPRPVKCTCGEYPERIYAGYTKEYCLIHRHKGSKLMTDWYYTLNEAIIAWNKMIEEALK